MSQIRTRWAAIGAAVAVTLGAGSIGLVSATDPANATAFVAITPCRAIDTRPDFNVGSKTSPVGPTEEHSVTAVGTSGDCTEVPANAVAVSLNVTAINATLPTFITVYATGTARPVASSLNPQPGAPPTPNAVTTELSAAGAFTIFNRQGSVDVIADINGYYVDHDHDEIRRVSIGLPAQALNISSSGPITRDSTGLLWENDSSRPAVVAIPRPRDWTGTSGVTLRILFRRTTIGTGDVRWFARPDATSDGDDTIDQTTFSSDIQSEAWDGSGGFARRVVAIDIPTSSLTGGDWWRILIHRDSDVSGAYPDDVIVEAVELVYESES